MKSRASSPSQTITRSDPEPVRELVPATPSQPGRALGQSPFPEWTLLETAHLPIAEIAALALREGQASNPIYRVHRWFARRLGSQFRSILTAAHLDADATERFWPTYQENFSLNGAVTVDPFVGGGTSLVEASRCGAKVVGFDIDPVAAAITRFELSAASREDLSLDALLTPVLGVAEAVKRFHLTQLPDGREATVLHHFWVELQQCNGCNTEIEVHPHYRLAYDDGRKLQWAFCRHCHTVHELPRDQAVLTCTCGRETEIARGPLQKGQVVCSVCGHREDLAARGQATGEPPIWRLFAQEYLEPGTRPPVRTFKTVTELDRARYDEAALLLHQEEEARGVLAPTRNIPSEGRWDQRPLIHGITRYRQLFNERQLLHLTLLGRWVATLTDPVEQRLYATAFTEHLTTNCMYAGYAFGYRRLSPLFSIHGYRHITRPVELNPWLSGVGRGTYPNALRKIQKAVAFAKSPTSIGVVGRDTPTRPIGPADGWVSADPREVVEGRAEAAISATSATQLSGLPDASVHLILSDPPYFDNLSYSELSDFYLAWQQALGMAEPPYDIPGSSAPILTNLAATKRSVSAIARYTRELTAVFRECRRVIRPDGLFVFTYHHRSAEAWAAVGEALARSGFHCTRVLPLRGEGQNGLHSFEGTLKWDAVMVCRPSDSMAEQALSPLVQQGAIATALDETEGYARTLEDHPEIGFKSQDKLNLAWAILTAKTVMAARSEGEDVLLLSEALESLRGEFRTRAETRKEPNTREEHDCSNVQI